MFVFLLLFTGQCWAPLTTCFNLVRRNMLLLRVFLRLSPLTCFPALIAVGSFSRANRGSWLLFPRLLQLAPFSALIAAVGSFSRANRGSWLVFPRLLQLAHFPALIAAVDSFSGAFYH